MSARKLSPTQVVVLTNLAAGEPLTRQWDVWGPRLSGGWFKWFFSRRTAVAASTVDSLERLGLLQRSERVRIASGRHEQNATLTEAGAALSLVRGEKP